jgi:PhnB protein
MPDVKTVPQGFHTITPYLFVRGAASAIAFYKKVFGATEIHSMADANGRILHAELRMGDSVIMLADENAQMGALSPLSIGGVSSAFYVYLANVDEVVEKAVLAGAKLDRPVENQFYGDRNGTVIDPFGHKWSIATHVEDVPPEEIGRRATAAMNRAAGS